MANTTDTDPRGTNQLDNRASNMALDLNTASEHDIAEIDMIGKKLAHSIVEQRNRRGGFGSWDELKGIEGLDPMKLAELQRAARLVAKDRIGG